MDAYELYNKNRKVPRVVHCKLEPFDIYVGRGNCSRFGNPFSHKEGTAAMYQVATIEDAISRFEGWLLSQPDLVDLVKRELRGKVLGCWCKTKKNTDAPCHGDVLLRIANED